MKKVVFLLTGFALMGSLSAQAQRSEPQRQASQKILTASDSLKVREWFFSGIREKTIQNFQLATDLFTQVVNLDPNNDAALYELSHLHNVQAQFAKAEEYIKRAVALKPDNRWYWLLLAEIYKRNDNITALVPVLDELIRISPQNEGFHLDKANALLLQDKVSEASLVYDEIKEKFGDSEDLQTIRQRILLQEGKPEKAISELEKQIALNPEDIQIYLVLSELHNKAGETEKALSILEKARTLAPKNGFVRLSLADIYSSVNKREDAFIELKEAFADPNLHIDQKVHIVLSFFPSFSDVRSRAQADELASIITKVHPDDPKAFAVYGDVLFQEQKLDEAKAMYQKALALNDQVYLIWEQLLRIEISSGDYQQVLKDGEAALSIFPNQAPLYLYTGIAYAQVQKHEKAVSYLKNASSLETENKEALSEIFSALGNSYNALKRYKDSDESFGKALEYNPDNSYTLNNYAYYLSLRGENLNKAEQMSRRSNELEPGNSSFEDTYAWILFKMKKYDDALIWIEKAIRSNKGNNGTLIEHHGDILYFLGEVEMAVTHWKKAREYGSKSELLDKKINGKRYIE